jgi:HSP20 family molecular chaperone IbpA
MFGELFDWLEGEFPPAFRPFGSGRMMRVEEYTDDGHYVLRAELPGLDPEKDLGVTIQNRVLTIEAHRQEETREGQRSEFRYGAFTRTVSLPADADQDDVTATYTNGILEVRVGLKAKQTPEPRQIEVKKS